MSIYAYQHSPCEHFASRGYRYLENQIADWSTCPDDDYEDEHHGAQRRWREWQVLYRLRGPKPEKPKRGRAPRKGSDCIADVRIDWPEKLPELSVWAGRATIETIIGGRQLAIWDAAERPDSLLEWLLPYPTMSGLDPRTAASSLDIGFSPSRLGMQIMTYVAAELLAIVGMQVSPVTRFGRKHYGYQDDDGQWWVFRIVEREGYHRMYTMSQRVNEGHPCRLP